MSTLYPDAKTSNADWLKRTWDLPPYKSKEFMSLLKKMDMTLEHFRTLPVYLHATEKKLIVKDNWKG